MSAGFMVTTSWPKSTMRMQPWCMIGEDCLFKPWMPGRRVSTGNTVLHSPKLPSCQMWSSISSAPGLWSRWRSASAMARRHRSWNPTWRTVRKQLPPWLRAGCGQMQPDLSGATRGQIWGVWGQQRVWTFQNPLRMFLGLLLLPSRNAFLTETFGPLLLHPLILTIQARIIQAANRSTQNCLGDEAETGRWSIWRGGHQHGGRGSLLWHHEHDRDHGHVWHLWQKVQSGILENKVKVFSIVYTAVTIYIFFYISCSFNPGTRRDQRTAKTGGSRSGRSILPKRAALMKILASLPACTTSFPWLTTTQVSAINNSLSLHCPQTNSFPVFQPRSENWREPLSNLTNLLWPRNSRQRWFPSWMRPRVPFPKSGWPPILMPKEMDLRAAMKHLEVPETSSALRHQLLISLVEVKRPPFTDRLSKFWVSQRS